MFLPKANTYVDDEIARATRALKAHEIDSKEYGETLKRLGELHKIRQDERPDQISTDTAVKAIANILGIYMILRYEHMNVITSKALSFVKQA